MYIKAKSFYRWFDNLYVCKNRGFKDLVVNAEFKVVGVECYCEAEFTKKVQSTEYDRSTQLYRADCIYDYSTYYKMYSNSDVDDAKRIRDVEHAKYDFEYKQIKPKQRMLVKQPKTITVVYDNFDINKQCLFMSVYQKLREYSDCDSSAEILRFLMELIRTDIKGYKECVIFDENLQLVYS